MRNALTVLRNAFKFMRMVFLTCEMHSHSTLAHILQISGTVQEINTIISKDVLSVGVLTLGVESNMYNTSVLSNTSVQKPVTIVQLNLDLVFVIYMYFRVSVILRPFWPGLFYKRDLADLKATYWLNITQIVHK